MALTASDLSTERREPARVMLIFWSLSLLFACGCGCQAASSDGGVLSIGQQNSQNPVCHGSLVLISPENERKTFQYDGSDLNCKPEALRPKFTFSTAEVHGCGKFSIHSGPKGKGTTLRVSGTSGPVSAREDFTRIKSITRRGCPKEGVAPYVIIVAIIAVILVVVGAGIFFKKKQIYSYISNGDREHVIKQSEE